LADLIGLGLVPLPLEVDSLLDIGSPENMVAASRALLKAQVQQECSQICEIDIGVRAAFKDTPK